MHNFKHHFLDTSVVLPSVIEWRKEDYASRSRDYLVDDRYKRLTSFRVYNEAKGVLNNSRLILTKYLKYVFEHSDSISPMNIESSAFKICNKLFPESQNRRSRDRKIVESYLRDKGDLIFSVANGDESMLNDEIERIRKAVETGLNKVDRYCKSNASATISVTVRCPEKCDQKFPNEYDSLLSKIGYSPDVKVILDAFFIAEKIENEIGLVTLDQKDMINHKDFIDGLLKTVTICDFRKYQNV
jgi:hypothetical protein